VPSVAKQNFLPFPCRFHTPILSPIIPKITNQNPPAKTLLPPARYSFYLLRGHAAPQHYTSLTADFRQQPFVLATLMRGFTNDELRTTNNKLSNFRLSSAAFSSVLFLFTAGLSPSATLYVPHRRLPAAPPVYPRVYPEFSKGRNLRVLCGKTLLKKLQKPFISPKKPPFPRKNAHFPPIPRSKRSCLQFGPCLYLLRGHAPPQHCTSLTADFRQQPFARTTSPHGSKTR